MLFAGLYGPTDPFLEPELGPSVVYELGVATIEFTQGDETQTLTLAEVGPNSMLDSYMGAMVTWRNDDGWIVRINAFDFAEPGVGDFPGSTSGDVTVERISGNEHWTASTYTAAPGNSCIVDVWEMSETVVSGRANCRNLRWTDAAVQVLMGEPAYIEGQEPFDITVTFEAKPFEGDPASTS